MGFRAVLAEDPADVAARYYIDRLLEVARAKIGPVPSCGNPGSGLMRSAFRSDLMGLFTSLCLFGSGGETVC